MNVMYAGVSVTVIQTHLIGLLSLNQLPISKLFLLVSSYRLPSSIVSWSSNLLVLSSSNVSVILLSSTGRSLNDRPSPTLLLLLL